MRDGRRAVLERTMVRKNEAARGKGDEGVARWRNRVLSEKMGKHIHPLDGKHPRLVHQSPALVGTQNPGMDLRGLRRTHRKPGRRGGLSEMRLEKFEAGR